MPADSPTEEREGPLLRTHGLHKTFGEFTAVDRVDLVVERGEFRSVIGPNGAGKTTLFNLITGAMPVSDGRVVFDDEDITDLPVEQRIRRGIGRSFQIINIFDGLTAHENVRLAVQSGYQTEYGFLESLFRPTDRYERINAETDRILDQVDLTHAAEVNAEALPYGDKRRLEIGVVLATGPDLVMLDEPSAGLSVRETRRMIDLINGLLGERTLLLIEHDVELVLSISDRITVLNRGEVIAEGTPEEITDDQAVQDAYLGGIVE